MSFTPVPVRGKNYNFLTEGGLLVMLGVACCGLHFASCGLRVCFTEFHNEAQRNTERVYFALRFSAVIK